MAAASNSPFVSRQFGVLVGILAVSIFLGWGLWGGEQGWRYGLINALVILGGGGLALLWQALQGRVAARLKAAVTPTPALIFQAIRPRMGFSEDVVLHVAASVDQGNPHPVAKAITAEAQRRGVPCKPVSEFRHYSGYGVSGTVDGRIIAMGKLALMQELGIDTPVAQPVINELEQNGAIVIFISINSYFAGIIVVSPSAQST